MTIMNRLRGRRISFRQGRSTSVKPIEWIVTEKAIEAVDAQAQVLELGTEGRAADKGDFVALSNIWSKQVQVASVMAAGEEDVLALRIINEQAEHLANLVVCVFFLIACINKVEQIIGSCEVGAKGGEGACLITSQASASKSFG